MPGRETPQKPRQHARAKVYAVKGDTELGKPIKARRSLMDVNERGRKIRKGVALWHVGTDTAKDLLHGRLQLDRPGPGYVHFSKHLSAEWFKGLTSEVRRPVRTHSGTKHRWVKTVARNEPLDTTVYALFCMEMLDLPSWAERVWLHLERSLEPDLFGARNEHQAPALPPADEPIVVPDPPARTPTAAAPRRAPSAIASNEWSSRL